MLSVLLLFHRTHWDQSGHIWFPYPLQQYLTLDITCTKNKISNANLQVSLFGKNSIRNV